METIESGRETGSVNSLHSHEETFLLTLIRDLKVYVDIKMGRTLGRGFYSFLLSHRDESTNKKMDTQELGSETQFS